MMRMFFALVLLAAFSLSPAAPAQSLSGRRAPSFSLPDATTKQHDILDYRGQWLLLDFMQTDNARCKEIAKKLETVKVKYGPKVTILFVVLAPPDNQQTAAKFVAENKTTSTIVFDQGQVTVTYFKATPQKPGFDVPHVFAINPGGMIVKDWILAAIDGTLLADLDQLIGGAQASPTPAKK